MFSLYVRYSENCEPLQGTNQDIKNQTLSSTQAPALTVKWISFIVTKKVPKMLPLGAEQQIWIEPEFRLTIVYVIFLRLQQNHN